MFEGEWPEATPAGRYGLVVDPFEPITLVKVVIRSFGYLHGVPRDVAIVPTQLVIDVRELFRDPHMRPEFRELTGRDDVIRANVLDQPGAIEFIRAQAAAIATLVPGMSARQPNPLVVNVAVGCAGGRHRSVVIAEALAVLLHQQGIGSDVRHLDIRRPVVQR
ncbi:ATPase [Amycolatopsis sp. NPDC051903]|uniref:RapZ C-terminal domain-containing protein n=1 Tax=Amycolatopsis sp. NPDC051903 TaxID=3363936 RepID=UPI00379F6A25